MAESSIEWTDTTTAYVAGIIDGEGSIFAGHGGLRPSLWGLKRRYAHPVVTIAMTDRGVIDWLGELLDVPVHLHNQTNLRRQPRLRPQWRVTVSGRRARALCQHLLPYLRVKRKQAELVIDWPLDAHYGPGVQMPEIDWFAREEFAALLGGLNG